MAESVLPVFAVRLYGNGRVDPSHICHLILWEWASQSFTHSPFDLTRMGGSVLLVVERKVEHQYASIDLHSHTLGITHTRKGALESLTQTHSNTADSRMLIDLIHYTICLLEMAHTPT